MASNISDTAQYPYSAVVSIRATFADGRVSFGTGTLIGKNDVLTATHVIYSPDYGGYATSIMVSPGADFDGSRQLLKASPFGSYSSNSVIAFPNEVFTDSNHKTNSLIEVASDVAVIGLSEAVGFRTGWFGLSGEMNDINETIAIGYPSDASGMVSGNVLSHSSNGMWISAYSFDDSVLMGSGSSGGPLYLIDKSLPSIIGVKSSGNAYVNYWADIDYKFEAIQEAIHSNDQLIGGSQFIDGTPQQDRFIGKKLNLVIDGLDGIDLVSYNGQSSQAIIARTGSDVVVVVDRGRATQGDVLTNIERLKFTDTSFAFDVGPAENAGSIYMLYKAAFNRAPDPKGMGYWLAQIDGGKNIVTDIAAGFVTVPEFVAKYGTNPSNAFYVDQLYKNVLGRPGDDGGVVYWNAELDAGKRSKAEVLVQFATLPEGAALVANLIANGIPYQEWVG